ncbi:MAG: hypothetical protein WD757_08650 [Actinomycetota bacterium]
MEPDVAWVVESSKDGEKWRFMGKAWTRPGEALLIHGASRYLRYRAAEAAKDAWVGPLERTGDECMALIDLTAGTRADIWPVEEHIGLPVFMPGGHAGRLLRFEVLDAGASWKYSLEFSGSRE